MEKISNLLGKSLKRAKISSEVGASYICGRWESVVLDVFNGRAANESKADRFKNNTLFVKVSSSGWAQEFYFQQDVLIKEINKSVGKKVVNRIVFKF